MGRNKDQHVSNGWNLEKKTTLDSEKNKISEIINSMTDEDKDNLLSDETIDLYKKLIKKSDFIL
jgi:hypothetical protein